MSIETIIEEYRIGDDDKRLSLFLAHRDLREIFISIEDETPKSKGRLIEFPWRRKKALPEAA